MATYECNIFFSSKVLLQNVLYVSNLNCYLEYIRQLIYQNPSYYVPIAYDVCVLQDRSSMIEIGVDRLTNGVFCFSRAQAFLIFVPSFE